MSLLVMPLTSTVSPANSHKSRKLDPSIIMISWGNSGWDVIKHAKNSTDRLIHRTTKSLFDMQTASDVLEVTDDSFSTAFFNDTDEQQLGSIHSELGHKD